jgi:hypothetical protein
MWLFTPNMAIMQHQTLPHHHPSSCHVLSNHSFRALYSILCMIKIVCQFDEQLDLIKKLIGVGGWLDVLLDVPVLHKQNVAAYVQRRFDE